MSNAAAVDDNRTCISAFTTTKAGRSSDIPLLPTSSSRVTRSQWEQQSKLRALYAESKNSDPATTTRGGRQRSKENANENRQSDSMSPIPIKKEERDDDSRPKNGNSAVTPSPNADKSVDVQTPPPPPPPPADNETPEARLARRAAWPLKGITEPGENDCLFGRGGGTNHHPGNKRYRKIVEDRKGKYLASKRLDKPLVAMEIINDWRALDPPGRFLKQDDRTKFWNDVGDKKAREKTSQALREKTPVKQRDGDDHRPRERTARFEPGTSSPVGRHVKRSNLARDHSLGETFLGAANEISLEGFSWDDKDGPVVRNADANVSPNSNRHGGHYRGEHHYHGEHPPPYRGEHPPPYHGEHPQPYHGEHAPQPYEYVREHSLSKNTLSDASASHPAPPAFGESPSYYGHHYPGYGPPPPPPPPGHGPPPPYHHSHPPHPYSSPQNHHCANYSHHQPPQQRSREHSLQMNPLKGASTSQPARDTFAEEDGHPASPYDNSRQPPLPSPTQDGHGGPPPLPPPYYGGYGAPSPQHGWPTPPPGPAPPTPQFSYRPGSNPSAFGRYDSGARSNSLQSLGSSVDAYYDRRDSGSSARSESISRKSSNSAPPSENPASAGTSQDYSKIAELIRDSSDKTRSNSLDESNAGSRASYEDTIPRSKSMPYEESSPRMSDVAGRTAAPGAAAKVQKPNLLRKLSGGGMARNVPVVRPKAEPAEGGSVCRPEPVKRDTSNQPETLETKRSIKRVVLSRDQSAVARRLKEEQGTRVKASGRPSVEGLRRAELIDRKMSVEMNKLGLDDRDSSVPSLDRMTTEDVLASLIDDPDEDQLGSPVGSPVPKPLGEGDRVTTIDAIARDIAEGNQPSPGDWDDTLELMNEPAPVVHAGESGGVNADIAEKWLKGET
mmetsp:Transcript_1959/g.4280  ORF Transcript_1959/g.4280 Transcript_1959/m.4280 type:complete len:896 (+) Transcript_1959:169-2856(+)